MELFYSHLIIYIHKITRLALHIFELFPTSCTIESKLSDLS